MGIAASSSDTPAGFGARRDSRATASSAQAPDPVPNHLVARRERRHGAADSLDAAREIRAHGRRRGSAKAAAPHEELVDLAEAFLPRISPEEFPYLIEHAQQHLLPPDPAEKPEFEFGLDLILDGLERLRDVEQA